MSKGPGPQCSALACLNYRGLTVVVRVTPYKLRGNSLMSLSSAQFSHSVCPALCNPMNCSTPGLPVHPQIPESIQTHVHQVGDAVQPPHPPSSPSPPAPSLSQHQRLFK